MSAPTRLEVWGDPIEHSLSPLLHTAAYAELGWEWHYERRRVAEHDFTPALAAARGRVRGLSLTFPLKQVAFAAAGAHDRFAASTGAVNTLLLTGERPLGFNTDVPGLVADLRERGLGEVDRARVIGAGATATSAIVALGAVGAGHVDVLARRPEAAAALIEVGTRAGVAVTAHPMDASGLPPASVTISSLPGGAHLEADIARSLADGGGVLYDVVYGQWPTPLAAAWQAAGGDAVNGLGMLVQQAVRQIRVFGAGDAEEPLPRESAVVAAMRRALVGD